MNPRTHIAFFGCSDVEALFWSIMVHSILTSAAAYMFWFRQVLYTSAHGAYAFSARRFIFRCGCDEFDFFTPTITESSFHQGSLGGWGFHRGCLPWASRHIRRLLFQEPMEKVTS